MALTRWIFVLLFALCAGGLAAQTTYTVSNLADSGAGSLRQAIDDANTNSGADIIEFAAGNTGTISLLSALPTITEEVQINGLGRSLTTIDAGSTTFRIFDQAALSPLTLRYMTIQGGRSAQGAAIFSRATISLYDVRIQNCLAAGPNGSGAGQDGEGGAIYHNGGLATCFLTNCLITNCDATGGDGANGTGGSAYGGAIYVNSGGLNLLSTTIQQSHATAGDSTGGSGNGGIGLGGGIYAKTVIVLTDSIMQNCSASGGAGNGTGNGGLARGGAIHGEGTVDVNDTSIISCSAVSGNGSAAVNAVGGGISFLPGASQVCTIDRSILSACSATTGTGTGSADALGAAIGSQGEIAITESQISNSTATGTSSTSGSAVYHNAADTFDLHRSTIDNSTATGLWINGSSAIVIQNSTISTNSGSTTGGIHLVSVTGQIASSTITANTGGSYGGIRLQSGTVIVKSCIVAANTGGTSAASDYSGSLTEGGQNVIGIDDGTLFTSSQTGSTAGGALDPLLNALMDNGGLTDTHSLQTGSPAIDMGSTSGPPATDQRNAPRDASPDAGSYEFGAQVPGTQGSAGGEGDERCSVTPGAGLPWLLLLGLIALLGTGLRTRRV